MKHLFFYNHILLLSVIAPAVVTGLSSTAPTQDLLAQKTLTPTTVLDTTILSPTITTLANPDKTTTLSTNFPIIPLDSSLLDPVTNPTLVQPPTTPNTTDINPTTDIRPDGMTPAPTADDTSTDAGLNANTANQPDATLPKVDTTIPATTDGTSETPENPPGTATLDTITTETPTTQPTTDTTTPSTSTPPTTRENPPLRTNTRPPLSTPLTPQDPPSTECPPQNTDPTLPPSSQYLICPPVATTPILPQVPYVILLTPFAAILIFWLVLTYLGRGMTKTEQNLAASHLRNLHQQNVASAKQKAYQNLLDFSLSSLASDQPLNGEELQKRLSPISLLGSPALTEHAQKIQSAYENNDRKTLKTLTKNLAELIKTDLTPPPGAR